MPVSKYRPQYTAAELEFIAYCCDAVMKQGAARLPTHIDSITAHQTTLKVQMYMMKVRGGMSNASYTTKSEVDKLATQANKEKEREVTAEALGYSGSTGVDLKYSTNKDDTNNPQTKAFNKYLSLGGDANLEHDANAEEAHFTAFESLTYDEQVAVATYKTNMRMQVTAYEKKVLNDAMMKDMMKFNN